MFDQMSMPVLFAVLISVLAIVSIGVFVAVRVMAERDGASKSTVVASVDELSARSRAVTEVDRPTKTQELDQSGQS